MIFKESREQGAIASYLKNHHPTIEFETVEREGARNKVKQNMIKKNNSRSGWPDTRIYLSSGGYHSLMIENKANGTELFQKRINRFTNRHYEEQYKCHQALIQAGHAVYFGIGITNCLEIIERYISGNLKPFDNFDYISWDAKQEDAANEFLNKHGV